MSKELCNKTKKECGYLNFTNDVLDLMKKHNIKDVLTLETTLKEHELMKDIRITARFDLAQVNKEHKALEIIKEKGIDTESFYQFKTYEEYKEFCEYNETYKYLYGHYTQEEYELLKEVLL